MSKEKYRIGFYSRYETRLYTSFEELIKEKQRQIAISKMTPEQIEYCKKLKSELENR